MHSSCFVFSFTFFLWSHKHEELFWNGSKKQTLTSGIFRSSSNCNTTQERKGKSQKTDAALESDNTTIPSITM